MPVFLQLVQDGNGESKIISVLLWQTKMSRHLLVFLDIFKKHNTNWVKMQTVLSADCSLKSSLSESLIRMILWGNQSIPLLFHKSSFSCVYFMY